MFCRDTRNNAEKWWQEAIQSDIRNRRQLNIAARISESPAAEEIYDQCNFQHFLRAQTVNHVLPWRACLTMFFRKHLQRDLSVNWTDTKKEVLKVKSPDGGRHQQGKTSSFPGPLRLEGSNDRKDPGNEMKRNLVVHPLLINTISPYWLLLGLRIWW